MSQNKRKFDVYIARKRLFICSNPLLTIVRCHFLQQENALDKRRFLINIRFDCHDTINNLQKLLRLLRGQLAYDLR